MRRRHPPRRQPARSAPTAAARAATLIAIAIAGLRADRTDAAPTTLVLLPGVLTARAAAPAHPATATTTTGAELK